MTQYRSHVWVTVGVLFVALAVWLGNEGSRAGSAQTQDLDKTLEIQRYPDEPVQLVDLRIGAQSVKDHIKQKFKSNSSKWGLDSVKFKEKDDWYKRVSITLRNTSDKPVFALVGFLIFKPSGYPMLFGLPLTASRELGKDPLLPGAQIELSVNPGLLNNTLTDMKNHGVDVSNADVSFSLDTVMYSEELRWDRGKLVRPDSAVPGKWVPIDQPVAMKRNKPSSASFLPAAFRPAAPAKAPAPVFATCKENLNAFQGVTCSGDVSVDCIQRTDLDTSINSGTESLFQMNAPCIMNNFSGQSCTHTTTHTRWQTDPNCQSCPDADGDGYTAASCGGPDCDDSNPNVNPGHAEVCNNGIDDNCDGVAREILECDWGECPDTCYGNVNFCTYPGTGCASGESRSGNCCYKPSPIVVDVSGNGFNLTSGIGGVNFDLNSDGTAEKMSWTAAGSDDAWLALDRNGNGTIDNGQELFGSFTPQPAAPPGKSRNGFNALAEYDKPANGGNSDGQISSQDSVFSSLRLWQDTNHNGFSEANELRSFEQVGLSTLDLDYKESRRVDQHGNWFRYRAKIEDVHGVQAGRWAWDVFILPGDNPETRERTPKLQASIKFIPVGQCSAQTPSTWLKMLMTAPDPGDLFDSRWAD